MRNPYWAFTRADVQLFLKSKVAVFWTLVFPILLLVAYATIFSKASLGELQVLVLNQDRGSQGASLMESVEQTFSLQDSISAEFIDVTERVEPTSKQILAVIPANFSQQIAAGDTVEIFVILGGSADIALMGASAGMIQGVVNNWGIAVTELPLPAKASISSLATEKAGVDMNYLVPGLIILIALSSSFMAFTVPLVAAREEGMTRQMYIWPVNHTGLLLAWALSKLIMVLIGTIFIVGFASLFFGFGAGVSFAGWVTAALVTTLGVCCFMGVAILLASWSRSIQSALMLGNLFYFVGIFTGNLIIPLTKLPAPFQFFLDVSPVNNFAAALRQCLEVDSFSDVVVTASIPLSIALFIIVGVVASVAGARGFKWSAEA